MPSKTPSPKTQAIVALLVAAIAALGAITAAAVANIDKLLPDQAQKIPPATQQPITMQSSTGTCSPNQIGASGVNFTCK